MNTSAILDTTDSTKQRSQIAALRVVGVTKTFPGVRALSSVAFDCTDGEVHARPQFARIEPRNPTCVRPPRDRSLESRAVRAA